PGGPSHQDIFDLKMNAPSEIRGEFKPISTNVPGIQICEHLPLLAKMMDKLVLIRSIVGATGDHYAVQCLTGRSHKNVPPGGWPCLGSTVAKLQGPLNKPSHRLSVYRPRWATLRGRTMVSPAFSAPLLRPSNPTTPAKTTWCSTASPSTASPTAKVCSPVSTGSAARWIPAA